MAIKIIDKKWWVLLAMALAQGTMFTDQTVIGIAQPTIQKALNISTGTVLWIPNAFFLAMAIFIGIGGRMGDFLQHKRAFLAGIFIFCIASFLSSFAGNISLLLIGRFIQGVGMAMVIPNAVVIIVRSFSGAEKGKAMGMFIGLSLFILPIGLFTASALMERWGWPVIFLQDMILAALSGLIAYYAVDAKLSISQKLTLDWRSLLTYTIGIASLVYFIMEFPYLSWKAIFFFALLAIIFLVACFYVEKDHPYPIIDFNIFKNKLFLCAIVLGFCITTTISLFAFDTLYYQQVLGYPALTASMLFLPNILAQIIFAPVGGLVYDKYGYQRPVLLGLIFTIMGLVLNSWIVHWYNYWFLIPGVLLINIGAPFIMTAARTIAITSVNKDEQGIASGVYNIFDMLGGTVTLALLTLVIISFFRHLLNTFLLKFSDVYSFLSLDEFEKILGQSQSPITTQQLTTSQLTTLSQSAKFAFTSAYSVGLLFCAAVLTLALFYVLILFRKVRK